MPDHTPAIAAILAWMHHACHDPVSGLPKGDEDRIDESVGRARRLLEAVERATPPRGGNVCPGQVVTNSSPPAKK